MSEKAPDSLNFSASESKPVGMQSGWLGALNRKEKQWEQDNAPRIVGGLKLIGISLASASLDPFVITCVGFFLISQLISVAYGTKTNQKKLAAEKKSGEPEPSAVTKMFSPRKYPVESSAGVGAVAEVFEAGYGGELMYNTWKQGATLLQSFGAGISTVLVGVFAIWSYGNIWMGKEKKEQDQQTSPRLFFTASQSKTVGFTGRIRQYMKNNPVLVSSVSLMGICIFGIVGAVLGGAASPWYVAALSVGLVANTIQALLVTQKGFNVEGAGQEQKPETFQERIANRRGHDNLGPQPA